MCDSTQWENPGMESNTFPFIKEMDNKHIQQETKYKPST